MALTSSLASTRGRPPADGLLGSATRAGDRGSVAFLGHGGVFALADVSLVESGDGTCLTVLECRRSSCVDWSGPPAPGPTGCLSSHGRSARVDLPPTLIQPVSIDERGARVFVVSSRAWLLRQRASSDRARRKARGALDGLARRVASGDLCDPDQVGRLAARILEREDARPHFDWRHKDRSFLYVERPCSAGQRAAEGTYVVQTAAPDRHDLLRQPDRRRAASLPAPVFVAALAFMVERALRSTRPPAPLRSLAAEALDALEALSIVDLGARGEASAKARRG